MNEQTLRLEARRILAAGTSSTIQAIRDLRIAANVGLRDAKDAIEWAQDHPMMPAADLPNESVVAGPGVVWLKTGEYPEAPWRGTDDSRRTDEYIDFKLDGVAQVLRVGTGG